MHREPRTVTHEVADCLPTVKNIPDSAQWEPCWVIATHLESFDVKIVCDGTVVNVPLRFVRPLKVSASKLWPGAKVQTLRRVMTQIRSNILEGTVMPGEYMKHAAQLVQLKYPTTTRKQIVNKWGRMVDQGRVRAVVSKNPEATVTASGGATAVTSLTTGRI